MAAQNCTQKGCTGTIEDGYCNVCGHAAEKRRATATAVSAPTHGTASRSVITGTGSSPVTRGAKGSRRTRHGSTRTARRQLGAGLITLPELPSTDPEKSCLIDPKIPEHKRFCSNCDAPLKRDVGFCGKCGQKFSFLPSLKAGDVVASQYEVKGALAYGGLGWIYLAFDRVLSRYVVLKGLLNAHDASGAAAAVAERQFLAAVKHPNIVGIYNFVQHASEGFIVMEYIGGKTLKQIRQERGPLPPAEAVAYIHRILGAFSYLHNAGMVYCDFKPENMMLERDDVKLIDMGAVRKIGDNNGDIYCTVGYSAPETAEGPTAASDLYSVGRALAVLLADFRGLTTDHRYSLPSPSEVPVFAQQESLYRALLKATAENPDDRFESADEMAEQLLGVLREIVAVSSGQPKPGSSTSFSSDPLAIESGDEMKPVTAESKYIPLPLVDTSDPAARAIVGVLGVTDPQRRITALEQVRDQHPKSREVRLWLANARGAAGAYDEADRAWEELSTEDPWDWHVLWLRGRMRFAKGDFEGARKDFDQVYFDLPGELAPKLALAFAAERGGNIELARRIYDLVSRVDDTYVSAAFGLARCAIAMNDRAAAVEALARVPQSSSVYVRARVQMVNALLKPLNTLSTADDLTNAAQQVESLPLDVMQKAELRTSVLRTALGLLTKKKLKAAASCKLFGCATRDGDLRTELEKTLRAMAQMTTGDERIALVDQANTVRPMSWF